MLQAVPQEELSKKFLSPRRTPPKTTHILPLSMRVLFNFGFKLSGGWDGIDAGTFFLHIKARQAMLHPKAW